MFSALIPVPLRKSSHSIDKSVFVTYGAAGHPPLVHVRMIRIPDLNGSPASKRTLIVVIEILQLVRVLQIKVQRTLVAIDLQGVLILAAPGVSGGLKGGQ